MELAATAVAPFWESIICVFSGIRPEQPADKAASKQRIPSFGFMAFAPGGLLGDRNSVRALIGTTLRPAQGEEPGLPVADEKETTLSWRPALT
jgi:hypothetical protein